jgi:hypothetical protein
LPALLNSQQYWERQFAVRRVLGKTLADGGLIARDIKQIVGDLES